MAGGFAVPTFADLTLVVDFVVCLVPEQRLQVLLHF